MNCECNNDISIFKGDDEPKFIKVDKPTGAEHIDIIRCAVKIGVLPLKVFEEPEFPFYIDIMGDETPKLEYENECFMAIWYLLDGQEIKKTCRGKLIFKTKEQVIEEIPENDTI